MNPATRTKRVKAALRTGGVEILACYSEQPEWTLARVYNHDRGNALTAIKAAGFTNVLSSSTGPSMTTLSVWA